MPSRYRDALSEYCNGKLVVTLDFEGNCLSLHPLPDWEEVEAKLLNMPALNTATRRLQRMLLGYATEVEMDSNGRVSLPGLLRDKVNLGKKIMLVGLGKKLEIWPEDRWTDSFEQWVEEGPINADDLPDVVQNIVF